MGSRGAQRTLRAAAPPAHRKRPQTTTYILLFSPLRLPLRGQAGPLALPAELGPAREAPVGWGERGRHLGAGRHLAGGPGPGLRHTGLVALLVPEETALGGDPSV